MKKTKKGRLDESKTVYKKNAKGVNVAVGNQKIILKKKVTPPKKKKKELAPKIYYIFRKMFAGFIDDLNAKDINPTTGTLTVHAIPIKDSLSIHITLEVPKAPKRYLKMIEEWDGTTGSGYIEEPCFSGKVELAGNK
jgi:hypothetical protein